jgi:hypothetical protein
VNRQILKFIHGSNLKICFFGSSILSDNRASRLERDPKNLVDMIENGFWDELDNYLFMKNSDFWLVAYKGYISNSWKLELYRSSPNRVLNF